MPGKVHPDDLISGVFTRTGASDSSVVQGPADGEDAAAIDVSGETLVVSSDPISLAASHVGTLGVNVACNDVAVSGADPRWLTAVVVVPDEATFEPVVSDIDAAAREVGASIVGGHSEYDGTRDRPFVSLTAMGLGEFVPTGGARPGDRIVLTKAAAIEGTAILATDFGDDLGVAPDVLERAQEFLAEISVVPDARVLREFATAMHDPTEGGIAAGLQELARASDVRIEIERETVPVRPETRELARAAGVDPLRIFGSGAVVAAIPESDLEDALVALADAGIEAAAIGTARESQPALVVDGEAFVDPIRDDLYPLWEAADEGE